MFLLLCYFYLVFVINSQSPGTIGTPLLMQSDNLNDLMASYRFTDPTFNVDFDGNNPSSYTNPAYIDPNTEGSLVAGPIPLNLLSSGFWYPVGARPIAIVYNVQTSTSLIWVNFFTNELGYLKGLAFSSDDVADIISGSKSFMQELPRNSRSGADIYAGFDAAGESGPTFPSPGPGIPPFSLFVQSGNKGVQETIESFAGVAFNPGITTFQTSMNSVMNSVLSTNNSFGFIHLGDLNHFIDTQPSPFFPPTSIAWGVAVIRHGSSVQPVPRREDYSFNPVNETDFSAFTLSGGGGGSLRHPAELSLTNTMPNTYPLYVPLILHLEQSLPFISDLCGEWSYILKFFTWLIANEFVTRESRNNYVVPLNSYFMVELLSLLEGEQCEDGDSVGFSSFSFFTGAVASPVFAGLSEAFGRGLLRPSDDHASFYSDAFPMDILDGFGGATCNLVVDDPSNETLIPSVAVPLGLHVGLAAVLVAYDSNLPPNIVSDPDRILGLFNPESISLSNLHDAIRFPILFESLLSVPSVVEVNANLLNRTIRLLYPVASGGGPWDAQVGLGELLRAFPDLLNGGINGTTLGEPFPDNPFWGTMSGPSDLRMFFGVDDGPSMSLCADSLCLMFVDTLSLTDFLSSLDISNSDFFYRYFVLSLDGSLPWESGYPLQVPLSVLLPAIVDDFDAAVTRGCTDFADWLTGTAEGRLPFVGFENPADFGFYAFNDDSPIYSSFVEDGAVGIATRAALLRIRDDVTQAPLFKRFACTNPTSLEICSGVGSCQRASIPEPFGCVCPDEYTGATCEALRPGGDDDGSGGVNIGAVVGGTLGGSFILVCCIVCWIVCALGLILLSIVLCLLICLCIVLVVLAFFFVLLVFGVTSGSFLIVKRKKREIEAAYDLAAFDGYEGEHVNDGILRDFRELAYADLTFDKKIGEGAFGRVFRGFWREATIVAIKELNVQADEKAKREFIHEANIMARLGNHPNVIHFIGAVTTEERFYMISEFAQNGSLLDFMSKNKLGQDTKIQLLVGAAAGVLHLHAEGVVHRDIAARNFLVGTEMNVMVTDFGLSRVVDVAEGEVAASNRTQSNIGPVRWMAPESLRVKEYSEKSDVYMFGCFMIELLTGAPPFSDMSVQDVFVAVTREGARPPVPHTMDEALLGILQSCWKESPPKRPSMKKVYRKLKEAAGDDLDESPTNLAASSSSNPQYSVLTSEYTAPEVRSEYSTTDF